MSCNMGSTRKQVKKKTMFKKKKRNKNENKNKNETRRSCKRSHWVWTRDACKGDTVPT